MIVKCSKFIEKMRENKHHFEVQTCNKSIKKEGMFLRGIANQLSYAVGQNKAMGQSKYSANKDVRHDGRSYSYAAHNKKLDIAKNFGHWMRDNHPEVTKAIDIKAEHMNEYLKKKAETCRPATLRLYASDLRSISKCVSRTFGRSAIKNPKIDIVTPTNDRQPSRTMAMDSKDIDKIQAHLRPDSNADRALKLERATGARVEGLTHIRPIDIHIHNENSASVYIYGEKGGRNRTVQVYGKEHIKNLSHLKELQTVPERPIVAIKKDGINRAFNRVMHQIGIKGKYELTSVHAMRKEWAQRTYDYYRETHTKLDSIRYTNQQLGHGAERDVDLLGKYVANIH